MSQPELAPSLLSSSYSSSLSQKVENQNFPLSSPTPCGVGDPFQSSEATLVTHGSLLQALSFYNERGMGKYF